MGWVILALLLLWSWRAKAENEAEITNLLYCSNGQDWLPLQGAVIESSYITVGVQWKSITASMGVTIVLSVDGETQEEVLGVDPGDTGRVDFSMNLGDGSYTAEVTLKETASGKVLDSRSASFTVATTPPPPPPPPPICTLGETKCEGFNLYECLLVNAEPGWILIEQNSLTCGYVPPSPPPPPFPSGTPEIVSAVCPIWTSLCTGACYISRGKNFIFWYGPGSFKVLNSMDQPILVYVKYGLVFDGVPTGGLSAATDPVNLLFQPGMQVVLAGATRGHRYLNRDEFPTQWYVDVYVNGRLVPEARKFYAVPTL